MPKHFYHNHFTELGINQENFQLNEHDQINDITLKITI